MESWEFLEFLLTAIQAGDIALSTKSSKINHHFAYQNGKFGIYMRLLWFVVHPDFLGKPYMLLVIP